jgi:hypothetical protein
MKRGKELSVGLAEGRLEFVSAKGFTSEKYGQQDDNLLIPSLWLLP